jgi:hypothetical protein
MGRRPSPDTPTDTVAPSLNCPGAAERVKATLRRCAALTRPARSPDGQLWERRWTSDGPLDVGHRAYQREREGLGNETDLNPARSAVRGRDPVHVEPGQPSRSRTTRTGSRELVPHGLVRGHNKGSNCHHELSRLQTSRVDRALRRRMLGTWHDGRRTDVSRIWGGCFAGPPEWHRAKLPLNQQTWCHLFTCTNSKRDGIGFAKHLLIDGVGNAGRVAKREACMGNGEVLSHCVQLPTFDSLSRTAHEDDSPIINWDPASVS